MLEELLLHQFVLEAHLVYLLLLVWFDLKMENLSFQTLNLYEQQILVGLPHTLMVVQSGIVHPPVLFYVNVEVDQADLIPRWYTEQMQWLGWKVF